MMIFTMPAFAHKTADGEHHDHDNINIETLSDNIFMINAGGGGNIAVYESADGVFVIDNGLTDQQDTVKMAIEKVTDKPIRFLVNTHWHFDHVGNNDKFGKSGTTILAHENVRERMIVGGEIKAFDAKIDPAPKEALPLITYEGSINLHLGEEAVKVYAVEPAHTDGDSFIVFTKQNIIHAGDLFFNGFWPFIDASSGGSIMGMIAGVEIILEKADEQTKIIPGHGPLANKAALQSYQAMLKKVAMRLKAAKESDQTKEQWVASDPLHDLGAQWGQGFLPTAKFTEIVWDTM